MSLDPAKSTFFRKAIFRPIGVFPLKNFLQALENDQDLLGHTPPVTGVRFTSAAYSSFKAKIERCLTWLIALALLKRHPATAPSGSFHRLLGLVQFVWLSGAQRRGVYRYIYPPQKKKNQSTLNFLCGCFVFLTHLYPPKSNSWLRLWWLYLVRHVEWFYVLLYPLHPHEKRSSYLSSLSMNNSVCRIMNEKKK